jgi:hypothetical protein
MRMLSKGWKVVEARSMQIAVLVFRHTADAYVQDNLRITSIVMNEAGLKLNSNIN